MNEEDIVLIGVPDVLCNDMGSKRTCILLYKVIGSVGVRVCLCVLSLYLKSPIWIMQVTLRLGGNSPAHFKADGGISERCNDHTGYSWAKKEYLIDDFQKIYGINEHNIVTVYD